MNLKGSSYWTEFILSNLTRFSLQHYLTVVHILTDCYDLACYLDISNRVSIVY